MEDHSMRDYAFMFFSLAVVAATGVSLLLSHVMPVLQSVGSLLP